MRINLALATNLTLRNMNPEIQGSEIELIKLQIFVLEQGKTVRLMYLYIL